MICDALLDFDTNLDSINRTRLLRARRLTNILTLARSRCTSRTQLKPKGVCKAASCSPQPFIAVLLAPLVGSAFSPAYKLDSDLPSYLLSAVLPCGISEGTVRTRRICWANSVTWAQSMSQTARVILVLCWWPTSPYLSSHCVSESDCTCTWLSFFEGSDHPNEMSHSFQMPAKRKSCSLIFGIIEDDTLGQVSKRSAQIVRAMIHSQILLIQRVMRLKGTKSIPIFMNPDGTGEYC